MTNDALLNQDVLSNYFFHDYIVFLTHIEKNTIRRTATGNISLADIAALKNDFRQQKIFTDYEKHGWKIASEVDIRFLTHMKVLAEAMSLTYNRKGKLLISKNGRGYLHNIDPITQYWNMVETYWHKMSWEYISPSFEIDGDGVMDVLQKNQNIIWDALLRKGDEWIDFRALCQTIKIHFNLDSYFKDRGYGEDFFSIEYGFIKNNLFRLGCIEIEEEKDIRGFTNIKRLRSTRLGKFMFEKMLKEENEGVFDDCPICRGMENAKKEQRNLSMDELKKLFNEAKKKK